MPAQIDRAYLAARPAKALARLVAATLFEGRALTARGRWLNPLVRAVHAAACRLPQLAPVRAPLFLVGAGRSGTTWLGKVLSLHPAVGFLNEPKALWHAAIPDEDLIGSYTRAPARLWLERGDAGERARRVLAHGYGAFLALTRSARLLDKYPELVFRVECVRALFPDARFLWLVRCGSAACRSVASWSERRARSVAGERHDWFGAARRKFAILVEQGAAREADLAPARGELLALQRAQDMAALEWTLAMRAGAAAARAHPGAVLCVRYEELVRAPRAVVAQVLGFAGLEAEERVLRYAERTARVSPGAELLQVAPPLRAAFERTLAELGYAGRSALPGR